MLGDRRSSGWLVVDKPKGLTSSRVVDDVRRVTGGKVGHAGTLDPLASGVLPVAIGEATKTIAYAIDGPKRYRFRIRWGVARTTDDCEGEIVGESKARPDIAALERVLPQFTGCLMQTPPAFSALKIAGRRSYALARAGRPPSLPPRPVQVFSLETIAMQGPDYAEFEAVVGKGTYIRALARDLGAALGTLGHVAALRRLSVGPFTESDAIPLESFGDAQHIAGVCSHLLPIEAGLTGIPAVRLAEGAGDRLRCGQFVEFLEATCSGLETGAVVSAWDGPALVAMALVEGDRLRPIRVINR